jgi:hypothetical protein
MAEVSIAVDNEVSSNARNGGNAASSTSTIDLTVMTVSGSLLRSFSNRSPKHALATQLPTRFEFNFYLDPLPERHDDAFRSRTWTSRNAHHIANQKWTAPHYSRP